MTSRAERNGENTWPPLGNIPDTARKGNIRVTDEDEDAGFLALDYEDLYFGIFPPYYKNHDDCFFDSNRDVAYYRKRVDYSDHVRMVIRPLADNGIEVSGEKWDRDTDLGIAFESPFSAKYGGEVWYQPSRLNYIQASVDFFVCQFGSIESPGFIITPEFDDSSLLGFSFGFYEDWEEEYYSRGYSVETAEQQANVWLIKKNGERIFEVRTKVIGNMVVVEQEYIKDVLGKGVRKIIRGRLDVNLEDIYGIALSPNREGEEKDLLEERAITAQWRYVLVALGNPSLNWGGSIKELIEGLAEEFEANSENQPTDQTE